MRDDEWNTEPSARASESGAAEQERFLGILRMARERAVRRLAALTGDHAEIVAASLDSAADDEHDPEGATIAFERAQVDALVRSTRQELEKIEAALARAEEDRFGICERCGRPIAPGRLEARPTARTCIDCARRGR